MNFVQIFEASAAISALFMIQIGIFWIKRFAREAIR